jgi:hypothetical protein
MSIFNLNNFLERDFLEYLIKVNEETSVCCKRGLVCIIT